MSLIYVYQSSLQILLGKKNRGERQRKNHGTSKKRSNFVLREYESEVSPRPFILESQQIDVAKKYIGKINSLAVALRIAQWKKSAKYRPFQIASFMQEVKISRNKTS